MSAIEWRWEYKTVYEKYVSMNFDGKEYRTRASTVDADLLGNVLGTCTAQGYDIYTEQTYTEMFEVREIKGVSRECLVAVGMDGGYYVFMRDSREVPSTFGKVLDAYDLPQTLNLSRFTVSKGYDDVGYYQIKDDSVIWQILSRCRDAKRVVDSDIWERDRSYLVFTATSEALGTYKMAFLVTKDGYIWTNIFEYSYVYFIGEDAAGEIIDWARSNAEETEYEPYEYQLAGNAD